jgi:probable F420-dependent oxidoreductase
VKVGLPLGMLNPRLWKEVTILADQLGYESVWIPEHLMLPVRSSGSPFSGQEHPPIPPDIPVFDPFVYMGMLAGCTERIRFGTHVYNIGLRHPFVTARAVSTLDVVSGGRVELGVGASWLAEEWAAAGLDFRTRGRRVDEAIVVCRRLWRDKEVEHRGEFFHFEAVMCEPKPVQARIPVHVGGDSKAALRRAALLGDGWIPMNHSLEQVPSSMARISAAREEAGITPEIELTMGLPVEKRDDLDRYAEAGVGRVLVRPWSSSRDAVEGLKRFAGEVLNH